MPVNSGAAPLIRHGGPGNLRLADFRSQIGPRARILPQAKRLGGVTMIDRVGIEVRGRMNERVGSVVRLVGGFAGGLSSRPHPSGFSSLRRDGWATRLQTIER